jgi:hypothetical protein
LLSYQDRDTSDLVIFRQVSAGYGRQVNASTSAIFWATGVHPGLGRLLAQIGQHIRSVILIHHHGRFDLSDIDAHSQSPAFLRVVNEMSPGMTNDGRNRRCC